MFNLITSSIASFFRAFGKYTMVVAIFAICTAGLVSVSSQPIKKCTVVTPKITIASILNISAFLPIIPEACAKDENGAVAFISPGYLINVMLRGYGFMVSLVFYSFVPIIMFAGLIQMLSSTDFAIKEFNAQKIAENAGTGLGVAFLAYSVVFTILAVLKVDSSVTGANLESFFSF